MRALPAIALFAAGCYAHDGYVVDARLLAEAQALSASERARAVVPARRESDGKPVELKASALPAGPTDVGDAERVHVTVDELNRMVTWGSILTWVGSALSMVGTAGFLLAKGDARWVFGAIELAGEPPMLAGCFLWPIGLNRPPQEVRERPPGARLLSGARLTPTGFSLSF